MKSEGILISEEMQSALVAFICAYDVWALADSGSPEEGEAFVEMVEARDDLYKVGAI